MSESEAQGIWAAIQRQADSISALAVGVAEIRGMLSTRLKRIEEDIEAIDSERSCESHAERIKVLERIVWGVVGTVAALVAKTAWDWITQGGQG